MCVCWWGGGAVSSGLENIRGGVISRETAPEECQGRDFKAHQLLRCREVESSQKSFPESEVAPQDERESFLSPPAALVSLMGRLFGERISLCWGRKECEKQRESDLHHEVQ